MAELAKESCDDMSGDLIFAAFLLTVRYYYWLITGVGVALAGAIGTGAALIGIISRFSIKSKG